MAVGTYDVTDLEPSNMTNEVVVGFVEVFRHLLAEALFLSMRHVLHDHTVHGTCMCKQAHDKIRQC